MSYPQDNELVAAKKKRQEEKDNDEYWSDYDIELLHNQLFHIVLHHSLNHISKHGLSYFFFEWRNIYSTATPYSSSSTMY